MTWQGAAVDRLALTVGDHHHVHAANLALRARRRWLKSVRAATANLRWSYSGLSHVRVGKLFLRRLFMAPTFIHRCITSAAGVLRLGRIVMLKVAQSVTHQHSYIENLNQNLQTASRRVDVSAARWLLLLGHPLGLAS